MSVIKLGQFQVYTGDGKGKTTAALGLALRAWGSCLRVYIGQFMKRGDYGETAALRRLDGVVLEQYGSDLGLLLGRERAKSDVDCAAEGLQRLTDALRSEEYDVVIADEINCALACGLLGEDQLIALADSRPPGVELVFTGRGATDAIVRRADLVTEMRAIKHYYADKRLPARAGIEM